MRDSVNLRSNWFKQISLVEFWVRLFMYILMNEVVFTFIKLVLPLTLSTSKDGMEFVLNSVAILFVLALDDLAEPKTLAVCSSCPIDSSPKGRDAYQLLGEESANNMGADEPLGRPPLA